MVFKKLFLTKNIVKSDSSNSLKGHGTYRLIPLKKLNTASITYIGSMGTYKEHRNK